MEYIWLDNTPADVWTVATTKIENSDCIHSSAGTTTPHLVRQRILFKMYQTQMKYFGRIVSQVMRPKAIFYHPQYFRDMRHGTHFY